MHSMPAPQRNISKVRFLNPLNEARYRMNLQQFRIVMAAISHLDSTKEVSDQELYEVSAADLKEMGTDKDGVYSIMRKEVKGLRSMSATIPIARVYKFPELREYLPEVFKKYESEEDIGAEDLFEFSFVQSAVYRKGTGSIQIRFNHDFIPFIQKLKEHYTELGLLEMRDLTSVYAVRIYQTVLQFQYSKDRTREVRLEDLRASLGLEDKYPKFGMFNLRVLQPALKQINESKYTRYHIDMEVVKGGERGTKVERLIFKLFDKAFYSRDKLPSANRGRQDNEIDEFEAFMTPRQKGMYADWLAGLNEKKTGAFGFSPHAFYEWLRPRYQAPGGSAQELADWLKVQLGNSNFIQEIYDPWLRNLGFKPKHAPGR